MLAPGMKTSPALGWKGLLLTETAVFLSANSLFLLPQPQGMGEPSVYHAVVVIFLEFFAWGLLTTPMLTVSRAVCLPALHAIKERGASAASRSYGACLLLASVSHLPVSIHPLVPVSICPQPAVGISLPSPLLASISPATC